MKQGRGKILTLLFTLIFVLAILFASQHSPRNTKLVTIEISGLEDQTITNSVAKFQEMVEGIQTVLIDCNQNLYTFRYDTGKIDLSEVKTHFAKLGVKIKPIKSVMLLNEKKIEENNKFFSIKVSPASK